MNDTTGTTNRHFAKFVATGEDIVILGYRKSTNDLLAAFLSGMSVEEGNALKMLAMSADAQKKDYLLGSEPGDILKSAHHKSGADWQTFLIRQAATGRGSMVRKLTMKDVELYDPTQKAYFGGYGESVDPTAREARDKEFDEREVYKREYHKAMMNGTPLPEPPGAAVDPIAIPTAAAAPAAPAVDPNAALLEALAGIAAGQAAILDKLTETPTAKKTTTRRKSTTARKRITKKASGAKEADDVETPATADGGNAPDSSEE